MLGLSAAAQSRRKSCCARAGLAADGRFAWRLSLALVALAAPNALESAAANGDTRTLYLYHSHSKETIAATFRVNGHYDSAVAGKAELVPARLAQ